MTSNINKTSETLVKKMNIFKWNTLTKNVYFPVGEVRYVYSKFHEDRVPIVLIEGRFYWVPTSQWSSCALYNQGSYLIAFEKDRGMGDYFYWRVNWFNSLHQVILHCYGKIVDDFNGFLKDKVEGSCHLCSRNLENVIVGAHNQLQGSCGACQLDIEYFTVEKDEFINFILNSVMYKHLNADWAYDNFVAIRKMENKMNS